MSKRSLTVAVLALAVLVALALSTSPVGAKPVVADNPASQQGAGSANNPNASIQQGNLFCGADRPDLPVIGFSNYHRSGNTVSVNFHLKNAMPKANYRIELWGNSCSFFGIVKTVKTNSHGVANATGSVTVPAAATRFFATGLGPNGYNDTPAVTLAP